MEMEDLGGKIIMKQLIFGIIVILLSVQVQAQYTSYQDRLNEQYTSNLFRNNNAHLIDVGDDYSVNGYRNVFQYLTGKVPGLVVIDRGFNVPFVAYRNGYPAFYLDEVRVDVSALASVNMNDIAIVKVFRPPFMAAIGGGANGAIAVYTKDGSEEEDIDDTGR